MAGTIRKIAKKFFIISNIVLTAFIAVACLVPWLSPGTYWWSAILGLGMPVMIGVQLIFLVFWLIARSRWAWLPVVSILLSFQQIAAFFAFGTSSWKEEKIEGNIRVMTWNVSRWDEYNKKKKGGVSYRDVMLDVVRKQDADILCFQEFFEARIPKKYDPNIVEFTKKMGYPYYYFAIEQVMYSGTYMIGNIIFSRFPIIDSGMVRIGKGRRHENMAFCDVDINGKKLRVVNTHLQSVLFDEGDYRGIDNIGASKQETLQASKTILSKLKRAYYYRSLQADTIRLELDKSPYPILLSGDFNDVPTSYTYFIIKKDMKDAFLERGSGIGRTFVKISPTLRIDFILTDPSIKIEQYKRPEIFYSDHYPQVVDISLEELVAPSTQDPN